MTTSKKCKKGFPCGKSCISKQKTCRRNLGLDGSKVVENYTQFIDRITAETETKPPGEPVKLYIPASLAKIEEPNEVWELNYEVFKDLNSDKAKDILSNLDTIIANPDDYPDLDPNNMKAYRNTVAFLQNNKTASEILDPNSELSLDDRDKIMDKIQMHAEKVFLKGMEDGKLIPSAQENIDSVKDLMDVKGFDPLVKEEFDTFGFSNDTYKAATVMAELFKEIESKGGQIRIKSNGLEKELQPTFKKAKKFFGGLHSQLPDSKKPKSVTSKTLDLGAAGEWDADKQEIRVQYTGVGIDTEYLEKTIVHELTHPLDIVGDATDYAYGFIFSQSEDLTVKQGEDLEYDGLVDQYSSKQYPRKYSTASYSMSSQQSLNHSEFLTTFTEEVVTAYLKEGTVYNTQVLQMLELYPEFSYTAIAMLQNIIKNS